MSDKLATPAERNSSLTAIGLIVIAGLALAFLVLRPRGDESPDAARKHPAVGAAMDDYKLDVLTGDGKPVNGKELHGKVVLLNFWGPWCGYCLKEFPHLAKLAETLRERNDFVWLPVTYPGDMDTPVEQLKRESEAYLARVGLKTTTYHDPEATLPQRSLAVGVTNGGFALPITILVDRDGHIAAVWNGYQPGTEKQIEAAVTGLLSPDE